jgi:cystathionine gamma-synthase
MPQKHVVQLCREILKRTHSESQACLVFTHPSSTAALIEYATSDDRKDMAVSRDALTVRVFDVGTQRLWVVYMPAAEAPKTAMYWINPGVGISTRQAQEALARIDSLNEVDSIVASEPAKVDEGAESIHQALRERIVEVVNHSPLTSVNRPTAQDVFLFPTGMAAIYRLHTYLLARYSAPSVLFGFPFHSTHHIFEDFHPPNLSPHDSVLFLGNADDNDLGRLRSHLTDLKAKNERIQALWTEFPSNPNCVTPDLHVLRALADEFSFVLILDDTVAGTANVDILPMADILVTSLTKSFSGYADVMGGSIILNPASSSYANLHQLLTTSHTNELYHLDASQLLTNSTDLLHRTSILNRNHAALTTLFTSLSATSPIVTAVFSPPTLPSLPLYNRHLRPASPLLPNPGHGLLLSVEFSSVAAIAAFHDALPLYKSPHLGAHVTLVLPYVKGLYDNELERVGQWGLKETQMRIAPGLEDEAELVEIFRVAVREAERVVKEGKGEQEVEEGGK